MFFPKYQSSCYYYLLFILKRKKGKFWGIAKKWVMREVNKRDRLSNIRDVFVFVKQRKQMYYTYTPSFRKDRNRVDWLFLMKTKPNSHVQVVKDGNDELTKKKDQLNELINSYRIVSSTKLEEDLNFHVTKNTYVCGYLDELNETLSVKEIQKLIKMKGLNNFSSTKKMMDMKMMKIKMMRFLINQWI